MIYLISFLALLGLLSQSSGPTSTPSGSLTLPDETPVSSADRQRLVALGVRPEEAAIMTPVQVRQMLRNLESGIRFGG